MLKGSLGVEYNAWAGEHREHTLTSNDLRGLHRRADAADIACPRAVPQARRIIVRCGVCQRAREGDNEEGHGACPCRLAGLAWDGCGGNERGRGGSRDGVSRTRKGHTE